MKLASSIALILALTLCGALHSVPVANVEYFFDTDPGPGNGTQLYARNTIDIDELIDTATLSPGIHRLCVRASDDEGTWGLPQTATFLLPFVTPAFDERTIAAVEYFFDSDPGPGNATPLYGRNILEIDQLIGTAILEPGIHRLHMRTQDDEGIWGLPQRAVFLLPFTTPDFEERTVAAIEYFFDSDPGPGNGIMVYGRNVVELDQVIGTSGLLPGIHRIYTRARDNQGIWSQPQSLAFLIPWTAPSGAIINQLEFFIDTDPGMGNGIPVAITPGASVSLDIPLIVGPVEHGNHCLYVRARNSEGGWGFPACCQFSDGIPARLTIAVNAGVLTISWEDLYGIDTYKVYSAPLPEGVFAEDAGGIFGPSDWTAPVADPKRFYRVTSIWEE